MPRCSTMPLPNTDGRRTSANAADVTAAQSRAAQNDSENFFMGISFCLKTLISVARMRTRTLPMRQGIVKEPQIRLTQIGNNYAVTLGLTYPL